MNDYETQKIRDNAFCSGYNTAVSKYEKQNKEQQKENAELKEALKGKRCNCMTYLNFKDLEKENAELKKDLEEADNATDCFNKQEEIIAKAKEIIKKLIEAILIWDCKNLEQVEAEAKQFLSEVEK